MSIVFPPVETEAAARPDRALAQDFGLSHVTVWRARQRLEQEARLAAQLEELPQTDDTPPEAAQQVAAFLDVPVARIERVAVRTVYQPAQLVKDVARHMVNYDVSEAEAKAHIAHRLQEEQRRDYPGEGRPVRRPPSDEALARRAAKKRQEEIWGRLATVLYSMQSFVPREDDELEEDDELLNGGTFIPTPEEIVAAVPPGWDSEHVSEYLPQAIAVLTAIQAAWDARQTTSAQAAV